MDELQRIGSGQSTELPAAHITRITTSGLYVPTGIDGSPEATTAPIDIVDQASTLAPDAEVEPEPSNEAPAPTSAEPAKPEPAPPQPRPADPAPEPVPAANPAEPGGWSKLGDLLYERFTATRDEEPVTLPAVITVGVFALIAAVCAFLLSFQMILPVVIAAGWTGFVAYLGPIVIDVAAVAAAFMSVLSRHPSFTRTGMLLLTSSTGLSIVLNLAGHQVKTRTGGSDPIHVPTGWGWTVNLFSVVVPLLLAWLIHAFGKAITAYMNARAIEKDRKAAEQAEADRQAAEAARAEQDAAEAERKRVEQANAAITAAQQTAPTKPKTTSKAKGSGKATADRQIAVGIGKRDRATTPAALRGALDANGYELNASERAVKSWCAQIRQELGAEQQ